MSVGFVNEHISPREWSSAQATEAEQAIISDLNQCVSALYRLKGQAVQPDRNLAELEASFVKGVHNLQGLVSKIESLPHLRQALPVVVAANLVKEVGEVQPDAWLQQPLPVPLSPEPFSDSQPWDKLLLHFNGDLFGKDTDLEGMHTLPMLMYVRSILKSLNEGNSDWLGDTSPDTKKSIESLDSQLKNAAVIAGELLMLSSLPPNERLEKRLETTTTIIDLVKAGLAENNRVLIPGGWAAAKGGHSMYYEIETSENGTYRFRWYNRGAGLNFHEGSVGEELLARYPAYGEISDITEEDLFGGSFWWTYIEQRSFASVQQGEKQVDTKYSEFDIFESLIPQLGGKRVTLDLAMEELMSAQRSGTCTWKSLSAYLRKQLPYREYKLLVYHLKQQSLLAFYQGAKGELAHDVAKRNLFEKCMETYARTLENLQRADLISQDEYRLQTLNLHAIKLELAAIKESVLLAKAAESRISTDKPANDWTSSPTTLNAMDVNSLSRQEVGSANPLLTKVSHWIPAQETFLTDMTAFREMAQEAFEAKQFDGVVYAFRQIVAALPVPKIGVDPFWDHVAANSEEAMQVLSDLHDFYFRSCVLRREERNLEPDTVCTVYKASAIQDKLIVNSKKLEIQGLVDYQPLSKVLNVQVPRYGPEALTSRHLAFSLEDPKRAEEAQAILAYYCARDIEMGMNIPLACKSQGFLPNHEQSISADSVPPELVYITTLLDNDPGLLTKIQQANPSFDTAWPLARQLHYLLGAEGKQFLSPVYYGWWRQAWQATNLAGGWLPSTDWNPLATKTVTGVITPELLPFASGLRIAYEGAPPSVEPKGVFTGVVYSASNDYFLGSANSPPPGGEGLQAILQEIRERKKHTTENSIVGEGRPITPDGCECPEYMVRDIFLLATDPTLQVSRTIAFMSQNPQKLLSYEYRALIDLLLFEQDYLFRELQRQPLQVIKFQKVFNDLYAIYRDQGNIPACVFLLRISSQLERQWRYIEEHQPDLAKQVPAEEFKKHPFFNRPDRTLSLMKMAKLSNDERTLLYTAFIAACNDKTPLAQVAETVLKGLAHIHAYPPARPSKHDEWLESHPKEKEEGWIGKWISSLFAYNSYPDFEDRRLSREFAQAIQQLSPQLEKLLMDPQERDRLLNSVLTSRGQSTVEFWEEKQFPLYVSSDGRIQINVLTGRILSTEALSGAMPYDVTANEVYKRHFDRPYYCERIGPLTYEFVDRHGYLNQVTPIIQEYMLVRRKIGDKWYLLTENMPLPSKAMSEQCTIFCEENSQWTAGVPLEVLALDSDGVPVYHIPVTVTGAAEESKDGGFPTSPGSVGQIQRLSKGGKPLYLVDIYSEEGKKGPYRHLANFESCEYTHVWADATGQPKLIEFPRHHLSFTLTTGPKGEPRWKCREHLGFYLPDKQFVAPLNRVNLQSYLLLENAKGEQKVLIGCRPAQSGHPLTGKLEFESRFRTSGGATYLAYDFNAPPPQVERRLSGNAEGTLYLGLLMLSTATPQGYEAARYYLHPTKLRLDRPKLEEIEILSWIQLLRLRNKDTDPRAVALRLHTSYYGARFQEDLGSSNPILFLTKKQRADLLEATVEDLATYISTMRHSSGYHLPDHALSKLVRHVQKSVRDFIEWPSDEQALKVERYLGMVISALDLEDPHRWLMKPGSQKPLATVCCRRIGYRIKDDQWAVTSLTVDERWQKAIQYLWTHPGAKGMFYHFLNHLQYIEGIGSANSAAREKILRHLEIVKNDPDEVSQTLQAVLRNILQNPKDYNLKQLATLDKEMIEGLIRKAFPDDLWVVVQRGPDHVPPVKTHGTENILHATKSQVAREVHPLELRVPEALLQRKDGKEIVIDLVPLDLADYLAPSRTAPERLNELKVVHERVEKLLDDIPGGRVVQREVEHLKTDCRDYYDQQVHEAKTALHWSADENKLGEFSEDLERRVTAGEATLANWRERIVAFANQPDIPEMHRLQRELRKVTASDQPLSFEDIAILFARGWLKSVEGSETLYSELVDYHLEAAEIQQLRRGLIKINQALDLPKDDVESRRILCEEIGSEFAAAPDSRVSRSPACMVLQVWGNILLREEQVDNVELLLKEGKVDNVVLQAIMGSGKTSVLLTLLALLRADGTNLSILMIPETLIPSMSEEIRQRVGGSFGLLVEKLKIDGKTDLNEVKLREIHEMLVHARTTQQCLLLGPKTMHCLYIRFLLSLRDYRMAMPKDKKKLAPQLDLFRSILNEFKTYGSVLMDEVDLQLQCRLEVNFPTGDLETLPNEEIDLVLELYDLLLSDSEITEQVRYDFYPEAAGPNSKLFSTATYELNIKEMLAEKLLMRLTTDDPESPQRNPLITQFFADLTSEDSKVVQDYVLERGDPKYSAAFVGDCHPEVRNVLALTKKQLSTLLPTTLKKECDKAYGLVGSAKPEGEEAQTKKRTDVVEAIPFHLGQPSLESRHANAHETSDYTIQAMLKHGVPVFLLKRHLERLQKDAFEELRNNKQLKLVETKAYGEFLKMVGANTELALLRLSDEDIQNIRCTIRTDPVLRRYFYKAYVLPEINFYTSRVNSNGQSLTRLFKKVDGVSGTVSNEDTFSDVITTHRAPGVDAKTLFLIIEHALSGQGVITIPKEAANGLRKVFVEQLKAGVPVRALIDTGGYLNDQEVDQLAAKWSKVLHETDPDVEGLAYHNKGNKLVIKEYASSATKAFQDTKIKKENRVMIYRQPMTTGTDVAQANNAVALLTIGRNLTLRDLFQSFWRMRGVARQQRVRFVVADDVRQLILKTVGKQPFDEVTEEDIIQFGILNQTRDQGDDNVLAIRQKMLDAVQAAIMRVIMDPNIPAHRLDEVYVPEVEAIFSPTVAKDAWSLYGTVDEILPWNFAMEQEVQRCKQLLATALEHAPILSERINPDTVEKEIRQTVHEEIIPETIVVSTNTGDNQEVETETLSEVHEQQQQVQQQLLQQQVEGGGGNQNFHRWPNKDWPEAPGDSLYTPEFFQRTIVEQKRQNPKQWSCSYPAADFVGTHPELGDFAKAIDPRVQVSFNFAPAGAIIGNQYIPKPFERNQKFGRQMLIIHDKQTNQWQIMIGDQKDNRYFTEQLAASKGRESAGKQPLRLCVYDVQLGVVQNGASPITDEEIEENKEIFGLVAQAKLLCGEGRFTPAEKNYLRQWTRTHNIETMSHAYRTHVLANRPDRDQIWAQMKEMF